jgi:hypothetical protein
MGLVLNTTFQPLRTQPATGPGRDAAPPELAAVCHDHASGCRCSSFNFELEPLTFHSRNYLARFIQFLTELKCERHALVRSV